MVIVLVLMQSECFVDGILVMLQCIVGHEQILVFLKEDACSLECLAFRFVDCYSKSNADRELAS